MKHSIMNRKNAMNLARKIVTESYLRETSSDVSIYESDFDYFHVTKFDFDFFRHSYALLLNVVVFT
jgi:hypothetical protein